MTHNDIYTKFMIEYDKANVTSSYPSLTKYEAATILDKAYNAIIAQKVTGNNIRRSYFEADTKAVSDLYPLVKHSDITLDNTHLSHANVTKFTLPSDFMYFVQVSLEQTTPKLPHDLKERRLVPTRLTSHQMAEKFISTPYNMPWVKIPVCYVEDDSVYIVYDPVNKPDLQRPIHFTYIKQPNRFTKHNFDNTEFELSDTMAEELISLAIVFALENVESTRLTTKLNTRGLEG